MFRKSRQIHGFTLIELLVVVSIIALLISILLPAVGETRRQARISLDVSNQKQHAQGVYNYASSNKDTLPNVPASPGGKLEAFWGRRGQLPKLFAGDERPVGGWSFPGIGIKSFTSPGSVDALNLNYSFEGAEMWNAYWIVLGQYMVDGEGVQQLQDIFICPSHKSRKENWEELQETVRDRNGKLFQVPSAEAARFRVGSYRYSWGNLLNPDLVSFRPPYGAGDRRSNVALETAIPANININTLQERVERHPTANVKYPSSKVLFYMWFAWHNPNLDAWFEETAQIPVSLADGSARNSQPYRDGLAGNRSENTGPYYNIFFTAAPEVQWPGHFWINIGGINGREI